MIRRNDRIIDRIFAYHCAQLVTVLPPRNTRPLSTIRLWSIIVFALADLMQHRLALTALLMVFHVALVRL